MVFLKVFATMKWWFYNFFYICYLPLLLEVDECEVTAPFCSSKFRVRKYFWIEGIDSTPPEWIDGRLHFSWLNKSLAKYGKQVLQYSTITLSLKTGNFFAKVQVEWTIEAYIKWLHFVRTMRWEAQYFYTVIFCQL